VTSIPPPKDTPQNYDFYFLWPTIKYDLCVRAKMSKHILTVALIIQRPKLRKCDPQQRKSHK